MANASLNLAPVSVEGTAALVRTLRLLGTESLHALAAGLYQEGEGTMTEAKLLTPVESGNLRASGHISLPVISGTEVSLVLGFGGPAGSGNQGQTNAESVGYAVYVHENLQAHHPVGQAKFLETAVKARTVGMGSRLELSLRRRYQQVLGG